VLAAQGVRKAENLRNVPVSVEVVLVAGLAGGVHRGVPIRAGAGVRAGQRGVHFRHLQTGANLEKLSEFMLIPKFKGKKRKKNIKVNLINVVGNAEFSSTFCSFTVFYKLQPQKILHF
jgi:hypothetical protein